MIDCVTESMKLVVRNIKLNHVKNELVQYYNHNDAQIDHKKGCLGQICNLQQQTI